MGRRESLFAGRGEYRVDDQNIPSPSRAAIMLQAVFRTVSGETHFLGSDELHIVYVLLLKLEYGLHLFQIIPVRRHIKGPHKRENQTILVRFCEFLEYDASELLYYITPEAAEDLQHRFDHHCGCERGGRG